MKPRWTTPAELKARLSKRWDDGSLLRAYAAGEPFPEFDLPLRAPRPAEIGDDLGAAQDWVAELDRGRRDDRHYTLTYSTVGGRLIGRNQLPARAHVTSYAQAWAFLGVRQEVQEYDALLALTAAEPVVCAWVVQYPHKALHHGPEWPRLLAAYRWLDDHRDSGAYLREISTPGVDTKFAERHRAILAALLGVSSSAAGFPRALGLRTKPALVRLRIGPALGLPPTVTELGVRADELGALELDVTTAVIVENEITYLSLPVPSDGVILWGKGFEIPHVGRLPWLRDAEVHYWGDLDTHGFAMLDQLRAYLPRSQSFLMDRETLQQHRDRWVVETAPARSRLTRLTPDEATLYSDLVTDQLGEHVRLEQERVDWQWARRRLPYS